MEANASPTTIVYAKDAVKHGIATMRVIKLAPFSPTLRFHASWNVSALYIWQTLPIVVKQYAETDPNRKHISTAGTTAIFSFEKNPTPYIIHKIIQLLNAT